MSATEIKSMVTPDDLLAMPDGDRYELVDGQLVERQMGGISSLVGGRLFSELEHHSRARSLGWVWPADNGYQCFPDAPMKVRRPDVSFIRKGRFPGEHIPEGYVTIPPDLAVEVVSPNDLAAEVNEKVLEYLSVGVLLIWVVDPDSRIVQVYRTDGSTALLKEDEELSGEDVVPGFRCLVRDLFPPQPESTATA